MRFAEFSVKTEESARKYNSENPLLNECPRSRKHKNPIKEHVFGYRYKVENISNQSPPLGNIETKITLVRRISSKNLKRKN